MCQVHGSPWLLQDVEVGIKNRCQVQNALRQPGGRGQLNAVDVVFVSQWEKKRHRIRRIDHVSMYIYIYICTSKLQDDRKESTLPLCIALYMGSAGNQFAGDCVCLGSLLFDLHGYPVHL